MNVLRVVIADSERRAVKELEEMLRVRGCITVGKAYDAYKAIKLIRSTHPDLVILGGRLTFLDVAKTVDENWLAPLLLLTDQESWRQIGEEIDRWEFDYLEKPVRAETLELKMKVVMEKFSMNKNSAAEEERIHSLRTTRNQVDRAKDVLVSVLGLTELQAILRIQIMGNDLGISLADAAKRIMGDNSCRNIPA